MNATDILHGLGPEIPEPCRVLILGSMPGAASLAAGRYYAHPRNRFWPLMAALFDIPAQADYPQRLAALNLAGVGVWDVIDQCQRRGSLDTAIVAGSEVVNPLAHWLNTRADLRTLAFNGGKAAQAFQRHVVPGLIPEVVAGLSLHALPSTSPANAAFDLARLLAHWRVLRPMPPNPNP